MSKELYKIYSDPRQINDQADQALIDGVLKRFPVETPKYRLELSDLQVHRKEFTQNDEKEAILKSKSLTYPIRGTLKLIDKATGKVVDEEHNFPILDAFHLTGKHTLVYQGNNYMVANQLQLLPGVYTRSQENGELESHFNTGKGRSFTLTLDPRKGQFYITIASSNVPVAPLLKNVFQLSDAQITAVIPKELWEANVQLVAGKEARYVAALYRRMVDRSKQSPNASQAEMEQQLRDSISTYELHAATTQATLGKSFPHITPETVLLALRNLMEVYRGHREEDNRDSLQFKRVQNLPDYLRTRFVKDHESVKKVTDKIAFHMGRMDPTAPKIRQAVTSKPFNKVYSSYILDSQLVSTPSETNPVESLENVGKVTLMGKDEGGIGSDRAVPLQARSIDPSHLGILDPSRTPESGHAGIDLRFTITARRDREGNMYARVVDNAGKEHHLSITDMMNATIGFPHQEGMKRVQAQVKGKMMEVDRKDVNYWVPDSTDLYTVTTNMVPFMNSSSPGRLTMAGE